MHVRVPPTSSVSLPPIAGRKRVRVKAEHSDLQEAIVKRPRILDVPRCPSFQVMNLSPDKAYYFEDGDITLYTRDTVFKVHSIFLAQDNSCFEVRLRHRKEDGGDRIPMEYVLPDESPRQFRLLLWALYAPAFETTPAVLPDNIKIDRMLDISNVSHRYEFKSMEKWALDAIYDFFKQMPENGEQFLAQGVPRLGRIVKHADRYGHMHLREIISKQWILLMDAQMVRPADAMDFAEKYTLQSLRGFTYYHTLLKGRTVWGTDSSLSSERQTTLLSGFERLVVHWEALKTSMLALDSTSPPCEACTGIINFPLWTLILPAGDQCQMADVLGKLQAVRAALNRLRLSGNLLRCTDCLDHAAHVLDRHSTDFRDNLSDFFTSVS